MSGNKTGAAKARQKNLKSDPDFYKKIGALSWKNPGRSRVTGFALVSEELRKELGAKGGSKTKSEYRQISKEGFAQTSTDPTKTNKVSTGVSE